MNDEEIYNWAMGEWDRLYGHIDFYDSVNEGLDVPCITDLAVKKAREEERERAELILESATVILVGCNEPECISCRAKEEVIKFITEKLKGDGKNGS